MNTNRKKKKNGKKRQTQSAILLENRRIKGHPTYRSALCFEEFAKLSVFILVFMNN